MSALNEVVAVGTGAGERGLVVIQDQLQTYENFDSVQIGFGSISTGIVRRAGNVSGVGIERGASLVFSQSESGMVAVIRYPFRTELPGLDTQKSDEELIAILEPDNVTYDGVLELVASFFDWAPSTTIRAETLSKKQIGFWAPKSTTK